MNAMVTTSETLIAVITTRSDWYSLSLSLHSFPQFCTPLSQRLNDSQQSCKNIQFARKSLRETIKRAHKMLSSILHFLLKGFSYKTFDQIVSISQKEFNFRKAFRQQREVMEINVFGDHYELSIRRLDARNM